MEVNSIPYININQKINPAVAGNLNKKYITLTLRDYGFSPERNTSVEDIEAFCEMADFLDLLPVIVPDDLKKIKNTTCPKILLFHMTHNIPRKIKLYAESQVNIFLGTFLFIIIY